MKNFSTGGMITLEKGKLKPGGYDLILVTTKPVSFSYQLHLALMSHLRTESS